MRKTLLFGINIVFVTALLLTYLAPYISPQQIVLFAFLSLAYKYVLLVNFLFIAIWLVWRSGKKMLLSIFAILLGYSYVGRVMQLSSSDCPDTDDDIRIMSYNVRGFDVYNLSGDSTTVYKMMDFLAEEDPDIYCFQEFSPPRFNKFGKNKLHKANATFIHISRKKREVATLSRHPIIHKGEITFDPTYLCSAIYSDIVIHQDTLRVFNVHLESNKFTRMDHQMLSEVEMELDTNVELAKTLAQKLRRAFKLRAIQAQMIKEEISKSPYPIVLCGDFNDTPLSYTYQTVSGELYDAFKEAGKGFGTTYKESILGFRIDYILFDQRLEAHSYQNYSQYFSDHLPVSVAFKK